MSEFPHKRMAISRCPTLASCCGIISGWILQGRIRREKDINLPPMRAGDHVTVDFHLDLPELYPAAFSFSPAIADGTLHSYTMCDWIDNAITLQMGHGDGQVYGYLHLPCRVEVNAKLQDSKASFA